MTIETTGTVMYGHVIAKGSAAAFARAASFFNLIAFSLGGVFFAVGFLVALPMWFWRENCGLPPTRGREISCACSCGHSEPGWALSLSLLRFAILRRRAREEVYDASLVAVRL